MAPTSAMSGQDTIMINDRTIADLADGDVLIITYPNDIASVKTGKNGNSLFAYNAAGKQSDVVLKLIRDSADDRYMNGLLSAQQANFAGFPAMYGEFIKQAGDTKGNINKDTYMLKGGVFTKAVEAKSNVEGDTEQSTSTYHIKFADTVRVIT
jgi:hypothetical protein